LLPQHLFYVGNISCAVLFYSEGFVTEVEALGHFVISVVLPNSLQGIISFIYDLGYALACECVTFFIKSINIKIK
jgi:hypothetical protein